MRIILLGSTGQVGSIIYKQLCENFPNDEVIGTVRNIKKSTQNNTLHRFEKFLPFSDDWNKLGRADVIINCVGIIKETPELDFEKAHIGLTKLLIENREKIGSPKIIQISILGANENSSSPFSSTKAKADALLLKHPNTFIIRPSIVCTPGTMIVKKFRMLKQMSKWMFGNVILPAKFFNTKLQPVMGEDVAAAVCALCKKTPQKNIFNLVGPYSIEVQELLKKYLDVKLLRFPSVIFDAVYTLFYPLLKFLINRDQVIMLSIDNTDDKEAAEKLIERPVLDCDGFWRNELSSQTL